jgi:tetratricopeptide (TPR) repeat protein
VQLLEQCDAARFAPGGYTHARMEEVLQEVQQLLATLEEGWSRKKRRGPRAAGGTSAMLLLALLTLSTLSTLLTTAPSTHAQGMPDFQGPEQVLAAAHAAYEKGRFVDAILAYNKAEDLGVRNAALYYNLGNAQFKSGNLGAAIAAYRRSERLAPRDPLLRSNLDYVLSLRTDKAVQAGWPWPFSTIRDAYQALSLNEWFFVAGTLYLLLSVLIFLKVLSHQRLPLLRAGILTATALLLMSAVALGGKVRAERMMQSGVIVADALNAMSGPGEDYTVEFTLHEGTEVHIEVERPGWLRVSVGGTLRGWVAADGVDTL